MNNAHDSCKFPQLEQVNLKFDLLDIVLIVDVDYQTLILLSNLAI